MTRGEIARLAVARTLFARTGLVEAIERLGYVQADPIRAPARAQDLILFQRVEGYRAGDLEARYPTLPVFEDMMHNYGFFPQRVRAWLLPRELSPRWRDFMDSHRGLRRNVRAYLAEHGRAHPRELEVAFDAGARENGWGGTSSAATLMLEGLHREGKAAVIGRESGIRLYGPAPETRRALPSATRAEALLKLLVALYSPLPTTTLVGLIRALRVARPRTDFAARYESLVRRGDLVVETVDRVRYVRLPDAPPADGPVDEVRLLAPFDPLVWDRRRFEHLWGWEYRFEAYTPVAKRKLGYYALPLLWRDDIVGWANAAVTDGRLNLDVGRVRSLPRAGAKPFRAALDAEFARFADFLGARPGKIRAV